LSNFPVYGKDDEVPRIGDVVFSVGYGLGTGRASDVEMAEE
jgi:hypothetical protein